MKIPIKGPIISNNDQWIYDWFGIEAVSPSKVLQMINEASNEDLEVEINSPGGSVFDASEIYTALKSHSGKVTGKIVGIAASAASVIAMAADHLEMSPTGQIMIHNASSRTQGDYREMDHTSGFLKNVNQTIANAYSLKSGKAYEELLSMMDAETWLTPQQALEHKLIDGIMFQEPSMGIVASADAGMLPPEVIEKVRNELKNLNQFQITNQAKVLSAKGEEEPMNLEELKNNHPELYQQIKNEGYQDGVKAENERIKDIEDLQLPGNEALITAAKFETGATAQELAVEIIKAEKQRGQNFLQNRVEDADDLNQVQGDAAPENNAPSEEVQASTKGKSIADVINKLRGGTN